MKKIIAKLGKMRKAVDWVVYPAGTAENVIIIQSDKRIAFFDATTGKGRLSSS